ncbi:hypothetical protein BVRB_014440 [Beta vulgaris subsp. vulgaris]|uniref:Uncharacterized protein n=1 Tax=Beta vulgaris subsp. vulgaris TaxID=3555 RepID=A0A0J8B1I2_BETVV|nr:hypothetical protein BVRB_014440 [Beta vulgaris subsp. vulgaris]
MNLKLLHNGNTFALYQAIMTALFFQFIGQVIGKNHITSTMITSVRVEVNHTLVFVREKLCFMSVLARDGVIASGAADDAVRLFVENDDGQLDGPMYKLLSKKEKAHEMDVNSIQWSPTEKPLLASASDDGTIKIWHYNFSSVVLLMVDVSLFSFTCCYSGLHVTADSSFLSL